jgi:NAD(P)-dependent dehydrogenase (short-subunit alcohol dehydrogenase family)
MSDLATGRARRLEGRVAFVTGASQGLGAVFARTLALDGARVLLGDVQPVDAACAAIRDAGGEADGIACDVTDAASVRSAVDRAVERFGRLDILVNNAALSGALRLTPLTEISSAEWDRVLAVNLRGAFECTKAVVPVMRRQGYGKIVNIASGTAIKGTPGLLHYVASKGAVISLTRGSARELGEYGIRVNCIAPGLTLSESVRRHPDWTDERILQNNIASRALRREAAPDDLLGAIGFLCSADSDFITGQTLSVDGGSVMN